MTESGVFFATPQSHEKGLCQKRTLRQLSEISALCQKQTSEQVHTSAAQGDLPLSHKPSQSFPLYRVSRSQ